MDKSKIVKYYTAVCEAENITPVPLKFEKVGKGGACTTYNAQTMDPLSVSIDLDRVNDVETAILHEITHVFFLVKDKNPFTGKKDQSPKFRKAENRLVEKYLYSKFSELLWK